ncbi:MAG: NADH-quinone oxidoreductase subunit NuoE [Propionibacteriaceae bacterium]|jgi:NADH-quinone oxidoreductase subunit E|nr:NADH-quinone oxidoreductase subunit NuoE [Propionibacteriaceae bacterium]
MSDAQTEPKAAPDGQNTPDGPITDQTLAELRQLADRYPEPRSALLPMLHLIQSVEGRVSSRGVEVCADLLGLTAAQVAGVATFYTMYKRRPAGRHHIGVCTTALCAVMGGDEVLRAVQDKLGLEPEQTTADGLFSLERLECNAACDFAPVMMVDWEFMDNMTPAQAEALLDDLAADRPVQSTRGATITSWRQAERVLAGFSDGLADEGPSAGPSSLRGVELARQSGWTADAFQPPPSAATASAEPAPTSQGASK